MTGPIRPSLSNLNELHQIRLRKEEFAKQFVGKYKDFANDQIAGMLKNLDLHQREIILKQFDFTRSEKLRELL